MLDTAFLLIAREFLQGVTAELDPYTTKKGQILEGKSQIVLLTPSHIQFARYGRGPGKKPPLDNILQWVKSDNIIFDGLSDLGTAFAIQASIGLNGTKNWQPNAPNALESAIKANYNAYSEKLNASVVVEVRDQIYKSYEKVFPPQTEMKI